MASSSMVPMASACVPAASSMVFAFKPLSAARACVNCVLVAATGSTSAGRLRNAIPSPTARRMGKTKTQKIASGSRRNRRNRVEVNWYSELCSSLLIAQIPPREPHEDIFEGCRVGAEFAQVQAHGSEGRKDSGNGGVQVFNRQLMEACVNAMRLHAGDLLQGRGIEFSTDFIVGDGKLDNVVAAHRCNQLRRRSQGDDASMIHDGHAI